MLRALAVVIVCGLSAACAVSQAGTASGGAEVLEASEEFWATRSKGDAPSLALQFTETGVLGIPGLADAVGRDAIRALIEKRSKSVRIDDFKAQRRGIDVIANAAYEWGTFSELNHYTNGDSMQMEGRYLIVWRRGTDARWRVQETFYNFSSATPVNPSTE